jgi:hypothetical protein
MGLSFVYAAGLASAVFLWSSLLGLATIFYCLQFETSLFVASYDSQGHDESIRPRLDLSCLEDLGTDRIEITASKSSIVASRSRRTDRLENTYSLFIGSW